MKNLAKFSRGHGQPNRQWLATAGHQPGASARTIACQQCQAHSHYDRQACEQRESAKRYRMHDREPATSYQGPGMSTNNGPHQQIVSCDTNHPPRARSRGPWTRKTSEHLVNQIRELLLKSNPWSHPPIMLLRGPVNKGHRNDRIEKGCQQGGTRRPAEWAPGMTERMRDSKSGVSR